MAKKPLGLQRKARLDTPRRENQRAAFFTSFSPLERGFNVLLPEIAITKFKTHQPVTSATDELWIQLSHYILFHYFSQHRLLFSIPTLSFPNYEIPSHTIRKPAYLITISH